MTTFVNLMPHPVRLRSNVANTTPEPDSTDIVVEPERDNDGKPMPARVSTQSGDRIGDVEGVAVFGRTTFGAVEGLPNPMPDTIFLVSALVGGRPEVSGRDDVFIPGTGPRDGTVRNAEGQVYAVTRLVQA